MPVASLFQVPSSTHIKPLEHQKQRRDAVAEGASPSVTARNASRSSLDAAPSLTPVSPNKPSLAHQRATTLGSVSSTGRGDADADVTNTPTSCGASDEWVFVERPPPPPAPSAGGGERFGKLMDELWNKMDNLSLQDGSALQDRVERKGCMCVVSTRTNGPVADYVFVQTPSARNPTGTIPRRVTTTGYT